MQKPNPLGFQRIDAADAAKQQRHLAAQWIEEHPGAAAAAAAAPTPPKRPVGRPRKPVQLVAADSSAPDVQQQPSAKRNANWLSSPFIQDVLDAVRRHSFSWKAAVADLQRGAPSGNKARYVHLSTSTIRGWFEQRDGRWELKPQVQAQLNHGAAPRSGRKSTMPSEVEEECKRALLLLRSKGVPVNSHVIRWAMQSVFKRMQPALLATMKLSQQYLSYWARKQLHWTWRARTTAASKLPLTWEDDGVMMAKRIAALMEMHDVHPSLVINLDQTGANLVPSSGWTYERKGSAAVAVIGAEDKRQITAVIASSLRGDLLPLQLVFTGKTDRCHPAVTAASVAARVHLTHSDNHWSSQQTMKEWLEEVLQPYRTLAIRQHHLNSDASVVLVLDVWAVHKSEQFRLLLRTHHPHIHLVFVPANCTSKLQVADVALQRPFKAALRRSFHAWAAAQVDEQLCSGQVVGFAESFKMAAIKPLLLQWCVDSWNELESRMDLILWGWGKCCTSLYNVHDREKRIAAVADVAASRLDSKLIPAEDEAEAEDASDSEWDDSESEEEDTQLMDVQSTDEAQDELDVSLSIPSNTRKSSRKRKQPTPSGYMFNSQQIAMSGESS